MLLLQSLINKNKMGKAEEYYKKTRLIETKKWTLFMALSFAEEYHINQSNIMKNHLIDLVWLVEQGATEEEINERILDCKIHLTKH